MRNLGKLMKKKMIAMMRMNSAKRMNRSMAKVRVGKSIGLYLISESAENSPMELIIKSRNPKSLKRRKFLIWLK